MLDSPGVVLVLEIVSILSYIHSFFLKKIVMIMALNLFNLLFAILYGTFYSSPSIKQTTIFSPPLPLIHPILIHHPFLKRPVLPTFLWSLAQSDRCIDSRPFFENCLLQMLAQLILHLERKCGRGGGVAGIGTSSKNVVDG